MTTARAGLCIVKHWSDPRHVCMYSLHLFVLDIGDVAVCFNGKCCKTEEKVEDEMPFLVVGRRCTLVTHQSYSSVYNVMFARSRCRCSWQTQSAAAAVDVVSCLLLLITD